MWHVLDIRTGRGVSRPAGVATLEVPGWNSASGASDGNASNVGPQENPMNDAVESSSRGRVGCGDDLERRMERPGDDAWED
jgi:hypothetical protein